MFLCPALSKPHLFDGRGHNRQGSDSSVDRFIPKDEPAEPEPDNKVRPRLWSVIEEVKSRFVSDHVKFLAAVTDKGSDWTLHRPGGGATGSLCATSCCFLSSHRTQEW